MAVQVTNRKMNLVQHPAERCLANQQAERLDRMRPGDEIVVTRGVLWITQQGDPDDYMIQKGQNYTATGRGPVVVQAIKDSACYFSKN